MSLRDLNPRTRHRLRLHGWLLSLWCLAIGGVANWLMLRRLGVLDPVYRYAISAVLMYSLGLVTGVRYWLRHFAIQVSEDAALRDPATLGERMAFDEERRSRTRVRESARDAIDWSDLLGSAADLFSLDEAAWLLILPALVLLLVGVLMLAGLLPGLFADGLASLLAEVAVQFVFGTLIARRVLRPRRAEEAFMHIVGRTWFIGVLLLVLSAALGWALQRLQPGAVSIGDLFR